MLLYPLLKRASFLYSPPRILLADVRRDAGNLLDQVDGIHWASLIAVCYAATFGSMSAQLPHQFLKRLLMAIIVIKYPRRRVEPFEHSPIQVLRALA